MGSCAPAGGPASRASLSPGRQDVVHFGAGEAAPRGPPGLRAGSLLPHSGLFITPLLIPREGKVRTR